MAIEVFESNPDVISHAADRQMAHLRTFQSGKHAELSQRLLNEIAQAKVCLLSNKKKAYDAKLRGESTSPPPAELPESAAPSACSR